MALASCGNDLDPNLPCPRVAALTDAATITRFAAGGRDDVLQVDYRAEFADLPRVCIRDEEEAPGVTVLGVAPVIIVTRGLANRSGSANLRYFVSVVDENRNVLQRQSFSVSVMFDGNRNRVVYQDSDPPVSIDLNAPAAADVLKREVLFGFELSAAELEYNRKLQDLGRPR